ncbi:Ldh family oxidoreductase [Ruegeria sp. 2012CJ41-6]|uniref:Ldh family oxidoreductase n=1 Tax=Ruegeria spongiae TaxID=2942209 RepID=A0ABT0Q8H3_9RHOB|nr:Ldh family oxidoreductase [Ruegeria spongiae]MCL6286179.1 Ldh family oxidoreductase [Ruegeria spongiae]
MFRWALVYVHRHFKKFPKVNYNEMTQISLPIKELEELCMDALQLQGVMESDAREILDVLMYAELRGNNQGLVKIPLGGVLPRPDAAPIEMHDVATSVVHINANGSAGIVTTLQATAEAARRAQAHGIALVGTRNLSSSTGAIGFYAERLAKQGLVGIIMSGSPKAVAPAGGTKPIFGTNPIAISVPSAEAPITFDMSTASIAWYGVIQAMQRGEQLPEGLAFDADGNPTTDPSETLRGAIKAFAAHKGSGLALMIEMLTGPLLGNALAGDEDVTTNWGNLVIAIDPEKFGDPDTFVSNVSKLVGLVRGSAPQSSSAEVLLPGERGNRESASNRSSGTISVDKSLIEKLRSVTSAQNG